MSLETRCRILGTFFLLFFILVLSRLFYWQVIAAPRLSAQADDQHFVSMELPAQRGEIYSLDGFPLAANSEAFLLYASLPELKEEPYKIVESIVPFFAQEEEMASVSAMVRERLEREDLVWVPLKHRLNVLQKEKIEALGIEGLGFESEGVRAYPEASMAAQLLGFVGRDIDGQSKGYFGLEGYYDLELRGKSGWIRREKDPWGRPILVGEATLSPAKPGRGLVTTIDRAAQYLVEKKLEKGIEKYGAVSGTVIIMKPQTGAILAMASWPKFDQSEYWLYEQNLFPNPATSQSFEPGSIFKVWVTAAALETQAVEAETQCDSCDGPRTIAEYKIETWDKKYYPDSTVADIIKHSDNVGMVFVAEKLGLDKLYDYLVSFGFDSITGIDLEGEMNPALRPKEDWRFIDLATASFGQGIAVTPLQMVKAVGALANRGKMIRPFVVKQVISSEKEIEIKPKLEKQVVSPVTARVITEMMIGAVEEGEAKWAKPKGLRVAGKTGTAQIPLAGHYDEEKTITSFIGFAPADEPEFVMLVILREPTSSPWGSETAAPLWFDISKELIKLWQISLGQ